MLLSAKYAKQLITPYKLTPLLTQTPTAYFSAKNKTPAFKNKSIPTTSQNMKLVFDKDNKALIYEHLNGEVLSFSIF